MSKVSKRLAVCSWSLCSGGYRNGYAKDGGELRESQKQNKILINRETLTAQRGCISVRRRASALR
jgi:hypothetical protein